MFITASLTIDLAYKLEYEAPQFDAHPWSFISHAIILYNLTFQWEHVTLVNQHDYGIDVSDFKTKYAI